MNVPLNRQFSGDRQFSRRLFLGSGTAAAAIAIVTGTGAGTLVAAAAAAARSDSAPVINPIVPQRADPWLMKHTDGKYYFTGSVPEYDRIILRSSSTIAGLGSSAEAVVWTRPATGTMGGYIWAPELHHFDGKWHIYFAAGDSDDVFRVRIYVISTAAADPTTAVWEPPVRVYTHADTFSLDATTFEHAGTRYLIWAQSDTGVNSSLFIASMSSPSTLASAPVRIAVPTLEWETRGYKVNEGAAVIRRNGRIFVTFSASATDANYCMGLLTADENADLLNAASWTKTPTPVFVTSEGSKQYGPGHNSFTVDEAGNDVLVYHARSYRNPIGNPLFDPNRHARVQRLYWKADGIPDFGVPVGDGELPVRMQSAAAPGSYLVHDGTTVTASSAPTLAASQFRLAPGYAKKNSVVIEPILTKGRYLRIQGSTVAIASTEGSSSAFIRRAGLSDPAGASFESVDLPGSYLVLRQGILTLAKAGKSDRAAATFLLSS
ncbi:family 43 glycosylhydrolase [Arthrobacter sp. ISL-28]|uniref:family 43 glycosylhydrolase n=1 Tax=Arthrobacter sp. ISL-28 TaxID=2819108 RepID=UPI001BE63AD7|nr:family 43 glycosylhydrolase [Arthrobacter sp. ISL-28]MBT2521060.1 family 43 glycosylhydrolase [Arthrobacter sp. ISL-28]